MYFGRLVTAMVTPFDRAINESIGHMLEPLINRLIEEQQSDGHRCLRNDRRVSDAEPIGKAEIIAVSARYARGRSKMIAGTGSNDTPHSH